MRQQVVVSRSVDQLNRADWQQVCADPSDLLMAPAFLTAVEESMACDSAAAPRGAGEVAFWYLLAYQDDQPVGAACVAEHPLDVIGFAHPLFQKIVSVIRVFFPRYLKFRVTFCGLPVSTGGSNVRVGPEVDAAAVLAQLTQATEAISRERKTWVIVFKEFDTDEDRRLGSLLSNDYVRAESLPMNRIVPGYDSFAAMLSAMRSHYRYKISKSRKKFATSGLTLRRIRGPAAIAEAYTPALHAMYEQVTRKAEHRLEILPRTFFLRLSEQFPEALLLTTIERGDETLAFAWSMRHGAVYRNLFVGIDYEANEQTDAYFNLMIEDIAHAMDEPVEKILVGQSADDFKSRLGCESDPRFLYIKVVPAWLRWCFKRATPWVLVPPPPPPDRDVFKSPGSPRTAAANHAAQ